MLFVGEVLILLLECFVRAFLIFPMVNSLRSLKMCKKHGHSPMAQKTQDINIWLSLCKRERVF